jgi:hypothetical protein
LNRESGIRNLESGIRNLESGIGNRESGIGNRESGTAYKLVIPANAGIQRLLACSATHVKAKAMDSRVRGNDKQKMKLRGEMTNRKIKYGWKMTSRKITYRWKMTSKK